MTDLYHQAQAAAEYIRSRTTLQPRLGLILGSGLGDFAQQVENDVAIPYSEIPHFPQSTVEGHPGRLVLGTIAGVPIAVMQGRVHAYEGYSMAQVTFPVRVLGLLGVERLIVTNAAGGINTRYRQGAIVAISDHINLTGANAAAGPNEPRFGLLPGSGQRFFDMSAAYSPRLRKLAREEASKQGWTLDEGVYVAVLGPSYETPAEIRSFRTLGADLVGMSTVHEVIIARHMGIEVLGLSVVTNMAAGVTRSAEETEAQPIDHQEVMQTGQRIAQQFTSLLTALIPQLVG
ncbi:purine-nucleoside phosphorylase [Edaphobacter aggregans]|uniref:purine-nucleoside phosphorylase n=1 Tax=Edaphobacter aggregans TaxID=570835 RepID=UPI0005576913|nr:purine-nucleoside phosphorylase [Edaphobacter aggregans]